MAAARGACAPRRRYARRGPGRLPDRGPRTKPKALNAALMLARGTFTAVFDAEDRPAPDQLHRALNAFEAQGEALACVQARLTIDNTRDSWLAGGIMAQTPPRRGR